MNLRSSLMLGFLLAAAGVIPACSSPSTPEGEAIAPPAKAPRTATGVPGDELMKQGEAAGVHNLAEIGPGILRGAQPEGEASFAFLAAHGVRTILSVDGSRPDAVEAARHGIRTIHIPIEYAGVTRQEQILIAAAAHAAEGNLFVHCHHGKHRGPAGSGIVWMTLEGVSPEAAVADMKVAGTDPAYRGLYRDVANFKPVTEEELARVTAADLPPAARTRDLVETMVSIDDSFSRMKAVKEAGWRTPASMPDVDPAHEARILAEHLREMQRLETVKARPGDFRGWALQGEEAAWAMEKSIRAGDGAAAGAALDRVGVSCRDCHGQYRNN